MTPWYNDPVTFIAAWLRGVLTGWGLASGAVDVILTVLGAGILALLAMLWVIFLIWYERKLLGRIYLHSLGDVQAGSGSKDVLKRAIERYDGEVAHAARALIVHSRYTARELERVVPNTPIGGIAHIAHRADELGQ